jgi:hypothetical protein
MIGAKTEARQRGMPVCKQCMTGRISGMFGDWREGRKGSGKVCRRSMGWRAMRLWYCNNYTTVISHTRMRLEVLLCTASRKKSDAIEEPWIKLAGHKPLGSVGAWRTTWLDYSRGPITDSVQVMRVGWLQTPMLEILSMNRVIWSLNGIRKRSRRTR